MKIQCLPLWRLLVNGQGKEQSLLTGTNQWKQRRLSLLSSTACQWRLIPAGLVGVVPFCATRQDRRLADFHVRMHHIRWRIVTSCGGGLLSCQVAQNSTTPAHYICCVGVRLHCTLTVAVCLSPLCTYNGPGRLEGIDLHWQAAELSNDSLQTNDSLLCIYWLVLLLFRRNCSKLSPLAHCTQCAATCCPDWSHCCLSGWLGLF